VELKRLR